MELQAQVRTVLGKSTKNLKNQGLVPAEFYGRGFPNQTLTVVKGDFEKVLKTAGESTVITLLVDGKKHPSIIHDIQHDFISGEVIHVDFYGVHMDEKISAHVPIEFAGEAPAVKAHGGVLIKAVDEVEVEALPADLPHSFVIDLAALVEINQSVYVKDLPVPKNVKILLDGETALVTVMPPLKEEEVVAPVMDVSDVKVETEEKKAERDAGKAEAESEKS